MHLKVVLFTLSFLTASAYPLHRYTRETNWTDSNANKAHDKINLSKDVDMTYKSHIDSSSLYNQDDDDNDNPMAQDMQRKLNMESERLRVRLRQELAELQEKLSSSPAHLSNTLASMRERLAPLTQQLQSSLSSNTQELCGQLTLYLQGLEAQAEASPAQYQEAFHWITQTLEHSSSKLSDIISDFQTKTLRAIEHLKEITTSEEEAEQSELWQVISSRLGQEVSSLRVETQNRVEVLKAELTALLETAQPHKAKMTASMERFCQNAALQSQVLQAKMEKVFQELEGEVQRASHLTPSSFSSSLQPGAALPGDYSVRLSALIQDILHLVQ
ncbi:hypothetical protein INR49_031232 [Caranx melampygus]|nr:hypothetical protein INR49_031232 [Caranx melampygus]